MKKGTKQADRYRDALRDMLLSESALLKDDIGLDLAVGVMARLVFIMDLRESTDTTQLMEALDLIKKYRSSQRSEKSLEELIDLLLEDIR